MKVLLFLMVLLSLFGLKTYSEDEILINGNIQASPLVFEPEYNIVGIDIGTSWRIGYFDKAYSIGLTGTFDYTLYDNTLYEDRSEDESVLGNWLHTRILLDQTYQISPGFESKWAFGFIWLNNTITYGLAEPRVDDFYGGSFDFVLSFALPGGFLLCEILNRVDLLYSFNDDFHLTQMSPHYYGGLRFYIDFGIQWFRMFFEAKGQYWNYSNPDYKISTAIASGGLGISLHIPPIKIKRTTTDSLGNNHIEEEIEEASDPPEEKLDPEVEKLRTITKGEKVQFHTILFVKHKDELLPISFPILDQIITVLKEDQANNFIISAYAEYQENPIAEFTLYTNRAKKIKEYLVKGGIEEIRLKVSSIGQIVTEKNMKQGSTVIFRIAEED